jgi:hypothetical protein
MPAGRLFSSGAVVVATAQLALAGCGREEGQGQQNTAPTSEHDGHDCSQHEEPPTVVSGRAGALSPADRDALTTIRVTARVGAVTLRMRDGVWIMAGKGACPVPPRRVAAALDNLVALTSTRSTEAIPVGTVFDLQIDALVGERRALHFEIVRRTEDGDLVRLLDDSTIRVHGLDRAMWSPDPAAWCLEP